MPDDINTCALESNAWEIREFVPAQDATSLDKLDTSIASTRSYVVRSSSEGWLMAETALAEPVKKYFDIDLGSVPIQQGWVAVQAGGVRGFVGVSVEPWNMRLSIWHFYVDHAIRRLGAGRLLMASAVAWGRENGAKLAWIETSNLNVPGIQAYAALGFEICGFDTSLYRNTTSQDEFAVFMSRNL